MKDKKQTIQMVVLGLLVALFVGYFVFTFTAKKAPTQATSKDEPKPNTASAGQTGTTADKGGVSSSASASVVVAVNSPTEDTVIPPISGRDPFAPLMIDSGPQAFPKPRNVSPPMRMASHKLPPLVPNMSGMLPPIGAGSSPRVGQSITPGGYQKPEPQPFPPFAVTGVITGRENVGIIRLGDSRYIVKEGQRINGTYEVVSVSQEGVLLAHSGRTVFFKLGGEGNASQK